MLDRKQETKFFYGYIIVLAGFLIMLVMWGILYSFGVFFEPVSSEFGWTAAATSGAYSLFMLLHGSLYVVAGRINDRFGPKIVMTVCGFFLGLGYLLMSQISTIWQLYLFYGVIIGIGMSGSFVPLSSTVARWFVKRRGLLTGIVLSGTGFGILIMPPIANWLISNYGWRTSYIVAGITVLVLIILFAQVLRRDPSQMGRLPYGEDEMGVEGLNEKAGEFSLGQAIRTRQFWLACMMGGCFGFAVQSIMVHIAPYATKLGISAASAASILAVIGGGNIVGKIVLGVAGDRIGNKPAFIIIFTLMSVSLFWLLAAKELWMLYLFSTIFGFAFGGFVVLLSAIVAELFGLGSHGVILGSVTFSSTVGGAIGPVVTGRVFDITGSYQIAFLACAVVSVICIISTLFLRPITMKKEQMT